jgi:hypothetical protein
MIHEILTPTQETDIIRELIMGALILVFRFIEMRRLKKKLSE